MEVLARPENAIFITYAVIITSASLCVWIGSVLSITQAQTESMSQKDAYMFPVIGSATLFGLYVLFKMFSKEYVNMLLLAYFLFFGAFSLTGMLVPVVHFLFRAPRDHRVRVHLPFYGEIDFHWGLSEVIALSISCVLCAIYAYSRHWMASNAIAVALSVQGIALLSLGSYKTGVTLLAGLFFYDIFWVFGTDVMVTVAKSFDGPIKIVFPRNVFAAEFTMSMLGLGDIVIPGFFVALLLRYDVKFHKNRRPFFNATFVAYILGLVATIFVMHTFKAAQPALLYLVPFTVGASFFTAVVYGELTRLFQYEEQPTKDKKN